MIKPSFAELFMDMYTARRLGLHGLPCLFGYSPITGCLDSKVVHTANDPAEKTKHMLENNDLANHT